MPGGDDVTERGRRTLPPAGRIRRGAPDRRRHPSRRRHRRDPRLGHGYLRGGRSGPPWRGLKPNAAVYRVRRYRERRHPGRGTARRAPGTPRDARRPGPAALAGGEAHRAARGRSSSASTASWASGRSSRASLVEGERIVDQLRAEPVVVVQRERRSKEYRALHVVREPTARAGRAAAAAGCALSPWTAGSPGEARSTTAWRSREGGSGSTGTTGAPRPPRASTRPSGSTSARGDFASLQYLTKKELYKRTGDKKFLVRSPSLDDPEVLRTLAEVVRHGRAQQGRLQHGLLLRRRRGLAHLVRRSRWTSASAPTPSPASGSGCKAQYGSLEALNRAWHAAFANWDAVMPSTTDEARKTGVFPPWADHRTYMETSFAHAYQVVRDAVVKGDPRRAHRALGHAGHDALERGRLVPPRPRHRRLPVLRRGQPVGPPSLVRQAGGPRGLLDGLRAQRRRGAPRDVERGACRACSFRTSSGATPS